MNTLTNTTEAGEVYTANFKKELNGWLIDENGHDHVYVPYSRSFQINGIDYMATGIDQALRLGTMMIRLNNEAFASFEASHPGLNP
jgi:hypothetical protein